MEGGTILGVAKGHEGACYAVDACEWGFASGGADRSVRVWLWAKRRPGVGPCTHVLQGHSGSVWSVLFSGPSRVVSGSDDLDVRVWDIDRKVCLHAFRWHTFSVMALRGGKAKLYSASGDHTIRVTQFARALDAAEPSATTNPENEAARTKEPEREREKERGRNETPGVNSIVSAAAIAAAAATQNMDPLQGWAFSCTTCN